MNRIITQILYLTAAVTLIILAIAIPNYRLDVANSKLNIQARKTEAIVCQFNALRNRTFNLCDEVYDNKKINAVNMLAESIQHVVYVQKRMFSGLSIESAAGAGFVFNLDEGYIITAWHVVKGANGKILPLSDYTITINGSDIKVLDIYADNTTDFAVIIVDTKDLNYCAVGQLNIADTNAEIGETVFAIGHPFRFKNSVSKGIVSNQGISKYIDMRSKLKSDIMQIDAAVNGGNSGGPVLNTDGYVVGLAVASWAVNSSGNLGVNFAVPASEMKKCLARFDKWLSDKEFKLQLIKSLKNN